MGTNLAWVMPFTIGCYNSFFLIHNSYVVVLHSNKIVTWLKSLRVQYSKFIRMFHTHIKKLLLLSCANYGTWLYSSLQDTSRFQHVCRFFAKLWLPSHFTSIVSICTHLNFYICWTWSAGLHTKLDIMWILEVFQINLTPIKQLSFLTIGLFDICTFWCSFGCLKSFC